MNQETIDCRPVATMNILIILIMACIHTVTTSISTLQVLFLTCIFHQQAIKIFEYAYVLLAPVHLHAGMFPSTGTYFL